MALADGRLNRQTYAKQTNYTVDELLQRVRIFRKLIEKKPREYVISKMYGETIANPERLKQLGSGISKIKEDFGDTDVLTRLNTSGIYTFAGLSSAKELIDLLQSAQIGEIVVSLNAINPSEHQRVMRTNRKYHQPFEQALNSALTAKKNGITAFFSFIDGYHPGEDQVKEFCESHRISPIFRPLCSSKAKK